MDSFLSQLAFAVQYLHPVAVAISEQMQAAVIIHIIGPVAERMGEVEVRRYVFHITPCN